MIVFLGCRAAADGNCDLAVEFSVVGPDGRPYGEAMRGALWNGPPAPGHNLQLGTGAMGFILEPEDSLGAYTLKAVITDRVAGLSLAVEQSITAVEGGQQ